MNVFSINSYFLLVYYKLIILDLLFNSSFFLFLFLFFIFLFAGN